MNKFRKFLCLLVANTCVMIAHAQTAVAEETGLMRTNGKIYVVVAVVLTILIGLFLYVYSLDRKISKLEKKS